MKKSNFSLKNRFLKSSLELFLVALIGLVLPFWIAKIEQTNSLSNFVISPVNAQSLTPELVAAKVYEQMPDLPKANTYIVKETGAVNSDNTLVSRIVRYHLYVKARSTMFRLDWKLTLADYLNVNEKINQINYPGYNTLTQNPLADDQKFMDGLTLSQRQKLVDILVGIYNPVTNSNSNVNVSNPSEDVKPSSSDTTTPKRTFELPKPGGAELLQ